MAVDSNEKKTVQDAITEITNQTPNQFRDRLQSFAQQIASTQILTPKPVVQPPPPKIITETQSFEAPPVTLGNINETNSGGGTDATWHPTGGGNGSPILGWTVATQFDQSSSQWQWAVVPGILFDTLINGNGLISVTGCLAPGPIDPTDAAWSNITSAATVQGGYAIWVEGAYSISGWPVYNSVYINTSNWDGGEVEYATTTDMSGNTIYVQTFWRFLLGFVAAFNSDGSPQLVTSGKGILNLANGGDIGLDSGTGNPTALPIIYPNA